MGGRGTKRRGLTPLERDEIAHVTLHGAAGEVTGSAFLVETRAGAVLIDCGMVQGGRADEARDPAARFPSTRAASTRCS